MTGESVAWRVIEQGWSVVDADGNEVGRVDEVTGNVEDDIFDGITIGDGGTVLTRPRYVPAEHVAAIYRGEIVLDLGPDEVAKLEPYQEPVSMPLADLAPKEESPSGSRSPGRSLLERLFGRRRL